MHKESTSKLLTYITSLYPDSGRDQCLIQTGMIYLIQSFKQSNLGGRRLKNSFMSRTSAQSSVEAQTCNYSPGRLRQEGRTPTPACTTQ